MSDKGFLDYINSPQSSGNDPGDFVAFLNAGDAADAGGGSFVDFLNKEQGGAPAVAAVEPVPVDVNDNGKGRLRSAGASFMRSGGEQSGQSASFLSRALRTINDLGQSAMLGGANLGTAADLEKTIQSDPLYRAGQDIAEGAREAYVPNPKYKGEFFTDVLASGAGGLVPTVASALVNPYLAIAQGTAVSGQQGAEEAIKAGRPDLANRAAMINAAVTAASEPFLGVAGRLSKFGKGAGGSMVKTVGKAAGGEALQEGIEQVGQNLTASTFAGYNPNQGTWEGVPTAMAAGGILGGGVGGLARLASPTEQQIRSQTAANMLAGEVATPTDAPLFWDPSMPVPKDGGPKIAPNVKELRAVELERLLDESAFNQDMPTVPDGSQPIVRQPVIEQLPPYRTTQLPDGQPIPNVDARVRIVEPGLPPVVDTIPTPVLGSQPAPAPVVEAPPVAKAAPVETAPPVAAPVTPAAPVAPAVTAPAAPAPVDQKVAPPVAAPVVPPIETVVKPRTLAEAGAMAPEFAEPELNKGRDIEEKQPETLTDNQAKAMEIVGSDPVKSADLEAFLTSPKTQGLIAAEAANYPEIPGMAQELQADIANRAVLFLAKQTNPALNIGATGGFPVKAAIKKAAADVKKSAYVKRNEFTVDDADAKIVPDRSVQTAAPAAILSPDEQAMANEEQDAEEVEQLKARGFQALLYKALGLNPDEIAALRARFVGGADKRVLNPKAKKKVESPDFNTLFREKVTELAEEYDVPIPKVLEYFTRHSVANGNPGVAVDKKAVQDFVATEFPRIARFIEVVDEPTALTPNGKKWDGRATFGPNMRPAITLNLANISSLDQVARVVAEEAVHLVFNDPSVKESFDALLGTVTDEQVADVSKAGYSQQELLEEVMVKGVAGRFSTNRQQTAWRKLVNSIWAAMSRFFGINPSIEMIQDMIVAKALNGDSLEATDGNGKTTRYSVFDQDFQNSREVAEAKSVPGADTGVIDEVALAKGSILPQSFIDTIKRFRAGPIAPATTTKAAFQRANGAYIRAVGYMRPLLGLTELTDQGINRLPLSQVTPEAADLAHRAVIRGFGEVYSLEQKLNGKLGILQADYLVQAAKLSDAVQSDIDARFADGASRVTIDLYKSYLDNEIALTKAASTVDGKRLGVLQESRRILGLQNSNLATSTPVALQAIAKAMPQPGTVTALNTPQEMVSWLMAQKAAGWPAFGGTQPMNDLTFQFLAVHDPINNIQSAIIGSQDIIDKVFELRRLQDDTTFREGMKTNFVAAFKALGGIGKTNITPRQFAMRYAEWRDKYRQAVETGSRIRNEFSKVEERLRGIILAIDAIEKLRADPQFNGQVRLAADRMEQVTDKVITSTSDGTFRFLNPGAPIGSQVPSDYTLFSLAPNPIEIRDNVNKAVAFLASVDRWVATNPNNPALERTYEYAKRLVSAYMLNDIGTMNLTGYQSLVPFTYDWWWSLPKSALEAVSLVKPGAIVVSKINDLLSLIAPGTKGRIAVARLLGGTASKIALDHIERTDLAEKSIRDAGVNRQYGVQARKRAMIKQMWEHGFDVKSRYLGESNALYVKHVLEPLIASRQNPSQTKLGVGDWTPYGKQIRKGDIDLAMMETQYKNALHASSLQGASPANLKSTFGVQDVGYSRKSAGYDMKSERGTSEWAEEFSQKWVRATEHDKVVGGNAARMALLEDTDNFDGAVNGEVMETNIEYTAGRTDPQYKAYQNRVGNKAVQPTFSDMDAFLDWMAQERMNLVLAKKGPGTTTLDHERANALTVLFTDIERTTKAIFQNERKDIELEAGPLTGVGKAVTDVVTGQSSFTNQRGRMIGPSTYYHYSVAKEADMLKHNASYKLTFQKKEMDIYRASVDALILERNRQRVEQEKWVQQYNKYPAFMERAKFAAKQQSEVAAGNRIASLRSLDELINIMLQTIDGMKTKMENARVYEAGKLRMLRGAESRVSVSKLLSVPVAATNITSAVFIQPLINDFAIARGKYNMLRSLTTTIGLGSRAASNMVRAATAMITDPSLKRALARDPNAWLGLAKGLHEWTSKYTADRDYLLGAGWAQSETTSEELERWWTDTFTLPGSSGTTTSHDSSLWEAILNVGMSPLSMASTLGGEFSAAGERFGSVVQLQHYRARLNAMRADLVRAFETRKLTDPGWDDTSKPLRPFLPQEVGFGNYKALSWFRDMVAPVGTLENAFLNYYKRHQAAVASGADPLKVELFEPEVMKQALFAMQKFGNVVSDSGRGDATHGKGWTGAARAAFFRFSNYGIQLNELVRQSMSPDPRDAGVGRMKEAVALGGLFAALAALSLIALGNGQMLRELQNRRVPATATLEQLFSDPSATAFYRAYLAGGASLFMPTYGDHINAVLTGQQGRTITDMTSMIPGIGAASQIIGFAREVAQTGDAYYPAVKLAQNILPISQAVLSRTQGGEADLQALNAIRSLRSAAPLDVELRGNGARMSETTPLVRDAQRALANNDETAYRAAMNQAVAMSTARGIPETQAIRSFVSSVRGRDPQRTVFGRTLQPAELERVTARMSPTQRSAFGASQQSAARLKSWVKAPKAKAGRSAASITKRITNRLKRKKKRMSLAYA